MAMVPWPRKSCCSPGPWGQRWRDSQVCATAACWIARTQLLPVVPFLFLELNEPDRSCA
jgi:hypothetical protein